MASVGGVLPSSCSQGGQVSSPGQKAELCLFNILTYQSSGPSVLQGVAGMLHPPPWILQPSRGFPSPSSSFLYNPAILVTSPFYTFALLVTAPGSPLSPLSSPPPHPTWPSSESCTLWTFPDVPASGYAFLLAFNKLSPLPYPKELIAFPFLSFFVFFFFKFTLISQS